MIKPGTLVEIIEAPDQHLRERIHIGKYGIVLERFKKKEYPNLGFYKVLLIDRQTEIFHYRDLKQLLKP